jgi:hypothetical protein
MLEPGTGPLTSSELSEAMAYAAVEPYGEYREELRHGSLLAFTANIKGVKRNLDAKPDPDAWKAIDFMNFTDRADESEYEPTQEDEAIRCARIQREVFGM